LANFFIPTNVEFHRNRRYPARNNTSHLIFQDDGNLVLYRTRDNRAVWASGTNGRGRKAVLQSDGNLVVYGDNNSALWASNTSGKPNTRLSVQDDGNLVIYSNQQAVWSSNSMDRNLSNSRDESHTVTANTEIFHSNRYNASNQVVYMVFQDDGNLVLYRTRDNHPLWASGTNGRGRRTDFQADGNLVVYGDNNNALWASNTNGKANCTLRVQEDGNLVIYSNGQPVWASNTRA